MKISAKFVGRQLNRLKPLTCGSSLSSARKGQDALGKIMAAAAKKHLTVKPERDLPVITVTPKDIRHEGILLYLHGGGYTCGDMDYVKGVSSLLAEKLGMKVLGVAYRLAPESPFPAALEDSVQAYDFLLQQGYKASQILLCGESAGGGLIYALCRQLQAMQKPLPGGLIAISPWVDLTCSGRSYEENKDKDPTLTKERLTFFADCYAKDKTDHPLVSPLFGELEGFPPSLIFVGEKELLADDGIRMHKALLEAGCDSQLVVASGLWHGYVLYCLDERKEDFDIIEKFIGQTLQDTRKLRWMRLDNAAKIYPAARRRNWNNRFRLSATLTEPVNPHILQSAVDVTLRRFPSIGARINQGVFWYYIEELKTAPIISKENSYPFPPVSFYDLRKCALRVVYYGNRIGVEYSHTLTDGTGGMIFLKTLLAEYLTQLHHIQVPAEKGVLDRLTPPSKEEMEDSFLKYAGPKAASRKEATAYHLKGTYEKDGFLHVTTGMLESKALLEKAHEYGVSLTVFLTAVLIRSLATLQDSHVKKKKQKPVKVLVPVNLRNLFASKSLRNFALYTTPGIDPQLGEYSLEEIIKIVHHHMGSDVTPKRMAAKIATNVNSEKSLFVRAVPLFIKNGIMKMVFNMVGECKSTLCLSNLGNVALPDVMQPYVSRFDFVLGVQAHAPYNCGVVSYNGKVYINIIRNTKEPFLERQFFTDLVELGLAVEVESNGR